MTEKELLYVEDAVGHEDNLIKYINYAIETLSSDNCIKFFESELKNHNKIRDNLLSKLEECSNE